MKIIIQHKKPLITITYFEWIKFGKVFPDTESILHIIGENIADAVIELLKISAASDIKWVINDVPDDKKEYFEALGCVVKLASNKFKGRGYATFNNKYK